MAVKQYIGARYVPLLDGDYDVNKTYEPLTTVNYGNATYTSKKKVPAGVVPTDSNYWMQTGFGNQQVTSLLDWKNNVVDPHIQQSDSDIGVLQDNVTNLLDWKNNNVDPHIQQSDLDISALQDNVVNLQDQIDNIVSGETQFKKIVCVTDSYGTHSANNWMVQLRNLLNIEASDFNGFAEGGSGFIHEGNSGHTFQTLLSSNIGNITDKDKVDAVFVGGGTNDFYYFSTLEALQTAIRNFTTYCKTQFPNARIFCVYMGYDTSMSTAMSSNMLKTKHCYLNSVEVNGVVGIDVSNVMHVPVFREDHQHPNDNGNQMFASMIFNTIKGGSNKLYSPNADYRINTEVLAGTSAGSMHSGLIVVTMTNDITSLIFAPYDISYTDAQPLGGNSRLPLARYNVKQYSYLKNNAIVVPAFATVIDTSNTSHQVAGNFTYTFETGSDYIRVQFEAPSFSKRSIKRITTNYAGIAAPTDIF